MNPNIPEYIKDIFIQLTPYERSRFVFKYRHNKKLFSVEFLGIIDVYSLFSIKSILAKTGYKVMYKYNTIYIFDVDDFELLHGALKLHAS